MNIALVFAGGTGQRINSKGKPKQFLELHGKSILIHTLKWFEECREIDKIVVVCLENWVKQLELDFKHFFISKVCSVVEGGKTGQESIYNGLMAIKKIENITDDAIVILHDGVRPLIDDTIIQKNIESVLTYGSAITVAKANETITQVDKDNVVTSIANRSAIRIAKAPQSFFIKDIVAAHERAREDGITNFVDSASMMMHYGYKLHTVMGSSDNIKITTASDFYIFRALYEARENSQILGV